MKIAVTGANGFVGSNLANYLLQQGHTVTALIRPNADTTLLNPDIRIAAVDYCSAADLALAISDVEILVHNAGKTRTRTFDDMVQANVVLTRKLLSAVNCSQHLQQFVYISSQAASRPSHNGEEITEEDSSAPVTWYGKSKLLAERVIKAECQSAWTIVRPVPIYGEGDKDFLELFKLLHRGLNFRIGSQDKAMNLIHIGQLCEFIELSLLKQKAFRQVFFVSDGARYTQAQFTALVSRLLNRQGMQVSLPIPLAKLIFAGGELFSRISQRSTLVNAQKMKEILAESWLCNIQKSRDLLNWEPQANLEAKLRSTLDWYRQKGLL